MKIKQKEQLHLLIKIIFSWCHLVVLLIVASSFVNLSFSLFSLTGFCDKICYLLDVGFI